MDVSDARKLNALLKPKMRQAERQAGQYDPEGCRFKKEKLTLRKQGGE